MKLVNFLVVDYEITLIFIAVSIRHSCLKNSWQQPEPSGTKAKPIKWSRKGCAFSLTVVATKYSVYHSRFFHLNLCELIVETLLMGVALCMHDGWLDYNWFVHVSSS